MISLMHAIELALLTHGAYIPVPRGWNLVEKTNQEVTDSLTTFDNPNKKTFRVEDTANIRCHGWMRRTLLYIGSLWKKILMDAPFAGVALTSRH